MSERTKFTVFGQTDPTDNRKPLEWRSKYTEPEAKNAILIECLYVTSLLLSLPVVMLVLWLGYPKNWLHLSDQRYSVLLRYGLAWVAGVLGGTLNDAKWLYHTVARQLWHLDRRIWRFLTPHISGGLAFAMISLVASGVVQIFDKRSVESNRSVVGLAFLVGYFSDSAIGKLADIAETLFGSTASRERHSSVAKSAEEDKDKAKHEDKV